MTNKIPTPRAKIGDIVVAERMVKIIDKCVVEVRQFEVGSAKIKQRGLKQWEYGSYNQYGQCSDFCDSEIIMNLTTGERFN